MFRMPRTSGGATLFGRNFFNFYCGGDISESCVAMDQVGKKIPNSNNQLLFLVIFTIHKTRNLPMTYTEAKNYLESKKNLFETNVSLFIAPKNQQVGEFNLKIYSGEDNKLALEKFGLLNNDDLEVYATYREGNIIYYPTLDSFLHNNSK